MIAWWPAASSHQSQSYSLLSPNSRAVFWSLSQSSAVVAFWSAVQFPCMQTPLWSWYTVLHCTVLCCLCVLCSIKRNLLQCHWRLLSLILFVLCFLNLIVIFVAPSLHKLCFSLLCKCLYAISAFFFFLRMSVPCAVFWLSEFVSPVWFQMVPLHLSLLYFFIFIFMSLNIWNTFCWWPSDFSSLFVFLLYYCVFCKFKILCSGNAECFTRSFSGVRLPEQSAHSFELHTVSKYSLSCWTLLSSGFLLNCVCVLSVACSFHEGLDWDFGREQCVSGMSDKHGRFASSPVCFFVLPRNALIRVSRWKLPHKGRLC